LSRNLFLKYLAISGSKITLPFCGDVFHLKGNHRGIAPTKPMVFLGVGVNPCVYPSYFDNIFPYVELTLN
ncbi:MAG: hypothetical protein KDK90_16630, partial [Leptospiraceae bacterium]|nr:hypothetical protein [Leptospiraceae bacterium]